MIDTKKNYTVGGKPARFLGELAVVNGEGTDYPLVYAVQDEFGNEVAITFTLEGNQFRGQPSVHEDLVEVIPAEYRAVYSDGYIAQFWYDSRDSFAAEGASVGSYITGYLVRKDGVVTMEPR